MVSYQGYREAMATAGRNGPRTRQADSTEDGGAPAMASLLERHPDLDAVFAQSETWLRGRSASSRPQGEPYPWMSQWSDSTTCRSPATPTALTTVHQPIQGLRQEMAKMLTGLTAGDPPSAPADPPPPARISSLDGERRALDSRSGAAGCAAGAFATGQLHEDFVPSAHPPGAHDAIGDEGVGLGEVPGRLLAGKTAMAPSFWVSANTPTMSRSPRSWNS